MFKKSSIWSLGFAALLCVLTAAVVVSCDDEKSSSSNVEENAIQALVKQGAAQFRGRNVKGLMRLTGKGFVAHPGNLGRGEAARELLRLFQLNGSLELLHPQPVVEYGDDDKTAVVTLPFALVRPDRVPAGLDALKDDPDAWCDKLDGIAQVQTVELSLKQNRDGWLATAARFH